MVRIRNRIIISILKLGLYDIINITFSFKKWNFNKSNNVI